MYEIAHGIEVYYENKKEVRNIIFLADGTYRYYDTGAMIFELLGDDASYMLTKKVLNMIKAFPDYSREVSVESLTDGFKWLYGTITDDDLPIATELFRSSFNEAIETTADKLDNEFNCITVGDFLIDCYDEYLDHLLLFVEFLESIAAEASGVADDYQKEVAEVFTRSVEELYSEYTRKCSVRHKDGNASIETHRITNLLQLLTFEYCRLKKENKAIKQCINCGRVFIPQHRIDSIYCGAPSPQRPDKTCNEIGAQIKRAEKRKTDPKEREHHNTTCRLHNAIRRAKDRDEVSSIGYYIKCIDAEMKKYSDEKNGGDVNE